MDSFLSVDVVAACLCALCGLFASGASVLPAAMLFKGENGAFQCVPVVLFEEGQGRRQHPAAEMAKNAFFVVFEALAQATTQDRRRTNAEARGVGGFTPIGENRAK